MLTPDAPLIQSPVIFKKTVIPDDFNLLCWNIHKENLKKKFTSLIQNWKKKYNLDLILLQEARFSQTLVSIAGFPFVGAANIRLPKHFCGVVTAAGADPFSSQFQMTLAREAFISTRKNTLITIYRFDNNDPLMVVNVHAINFRSIAWYQWELSRLYDLIKGHTGPMILAGDFNCWRRSRKTILDKFTDTLDLVHARPRYSEHIKEWFGFQLDRVYIRDLVLVDIHALDCKSFSDHNPIIARFIRPDTTIPLKSNRKKTEIKWKKIYKTAP
ncbi:MAG: endonuclease/exonuclease/phosphatase family protein [Desulfobacteraceae bacterium]|nr:endonuclease/exonuclease/phosphatase family protein [Desulfobacteraceae bacterium]